VLNIGLAPFLEGDQTWKLSQWRFLANDEKSGENIFYLAERDKLMEGYDQ
jgi:hypothetical protein